MFTQWITASITTVLIFAFVCVAIGQEKPLPMDEPVIETPKEYYKANEKVYLVDDTSINIVDFEKRIAQLDAMIAQAQSEKLSLLMTIKNLQDTAKDISTNVTAGIEEKKVK